MDRTHVQGPTPPDFTVAFAREEAALLAERVRVALSVGAMLYALFWLLDLLVAGEQRWRFLAIRVLISLLSVLSVAATYSDRLGSRTMLALSFSILLLASLGISLMTVLLGGFTSDYYIGNLLVLYFVGLFMPWPFATAVAFCALVGVIYFGLNVGFYSALPAAISPIFFLLATSAFTCLANVASRRSRQRDLLLRTQLEAANRNLTELDQAKTRFFANVSHELRTPLMLILGPLEVLRAQQAANALLDTMAQNAQRLLRQVNMLLDFSKLDADRLRPSFTRGNVGALLEALARGAKPYAESRGIALEVDGLKDFPDSEFDPEQVETIAANLLSNALKFTPTGGRVALRGHSQDKHLVFMVEDSGPGIPSDEREAIFERFHQVAGEASGDKPSGTGLGLALVKELVALHQGRVQVDSALGRGATFTVFLPKQPEAQLERRRQPRRRQDRSTRARLEGVIERRYDRPLRATTLFADLALARPVTVEQAAAEVAVREDAPAVLVVEDNADLRAFLRGILSPRFRVEAAVDGVDGLEKMQRFAPDLVVSDINMPRMNGHELCRRLKADPLLAAIPVILLTAKTGAEAVVEGLAMGADDYVGKPFDSRELTARIEAQLRGRAIERKLHERESRLAAIGQYTSMVAHDLRSPLQAIVGHTEIATAILARASPQSEALRDLGAISQAADRAEQMMQRVVEFARTSSVKLEVGEVDVRSFLGDIAGDLLPILGKAGIELNWVAPLEPKMLIRADALQLRRMVENLLGNARDALRPRGERTRPAKIWLSASGGEWVRIRVADNGPGLPPELADRLFQPFATARKHGGFGLGLSIVANLAKAHGGSVRAEAQAAEGGAAFVIELPRAIAEYMPAEVPHH